MQLKEISMLAGTELKTKAMDLLVMSHGLRHENINPFIGEWLIKAYLVLLLLLCWSLDPNTISKLDQFNCNLLSNEPCAKNWITNLFPFK